MLRAEGHVGDTVRDEQLAGQPDPNIAEVCKQEQRVLGTLDLDFADIRAYPPADYSGIIVLRPHQQAKPYVLALLAKLLPVLDKHPLAQTLWIIDESGIRLRGPLVGP